MIGPLAYHSEVWWISHQIVGALIRETVYRAGGGLSFPVLLLIAAAAVCVLFLAFGRR